MMRALIPALVLATISVTPLAARTISYSIGGYVDVFARDAARARDLIKIRGFCASACTMYLGAHEVCVAPDAVLVFHGAYYGTPAHQSPEGIRILKSFYTRPLLRWIQSLGGLTAKELWMHGRDLITIGAARPCP